ncbi:MAG: FHA domain-containing protein [Verrucomicrobia bacterium]|nr:FHA domain-containing protein [Verrucomicrobiota bacterium]MBU1910442.1 FHA domain-containing protein [Verrucomicrobiota bacterium]
MASLIGMSAEVKGKTFPIDRDEITIGRAKDNVVVIESATVSGHHCAIVRDGPHFALKDLESTNGTRLNSKDITEAKLRPKDIVQIGSVEFLFDADQSEAVDTHSYAEAQVEVAPGPTTAPESFNSISPFGARNTETSGTGLLVITLVGVVALIIVVLFVIKLIFSD